MEKNFVLVALADEKSKEAVKEKMAGRMPCNVRQQKWHETKYRGLLFIDVCYEI